MYKRTSDLTYDNLLNGFSPFPFDRRIDGIVNDLFPSPNFHRQHDRYTLRIPVPGMTRDDIDVRAEGSKMVVFANKKWDDEESVLHHTFLLPPDANVNDVKARCKNGLLTIEIRTRNTGRNRVIKVEGTAEKKLLPGSFGWWKRLKEGIGRVLN